MFRTCVYCCNQTCSSNDPSKCSTLFHSSHDACKCYTTKELFKILSKSYLVRYCNKVKSESLSENVEPMNLLNFYLSSDIAEKNVITSSCKLSLRQKKQSMPCSVCSRRIALFCWEFMHFLCNEAPK